jgi:hypothetical protein
MDVRELDVFADFCFICSFACASFGSPAAFFAHPSCQSPAAWSAGRGWVYITSYDEKKNDADCTHLLSKFF